MALGPFSIAALGPPAHERPRRPCYHVGGKEDGIMETNNLGTLRKHGAKALAISHGRRVTVSLSFEPEGRRYLWTTDRQDFRIGRR